MIGTSLGGASALLGSPLSIDALVIGHLLLTVTDAVHNRVSHKVGPLHHLLSPLLLCSSGPALECLRISCDR